MIQSSLLNIYRQGQIDAIRASVDRVIDDSQYDEFTTPLESSSDVIDDELDSSDENTLSSREAPIWKFLKDRKIKIDVLSRCIQNIRKHATDICSVVYGYEKTVQESSSGNRKTNVPNLDLTLTESSDQAILQKSEIISQQVTQVLLESQQQSLRRDHVLQEFSHVTRSVEYLKSEAENLSEDSQSVSSQVSDLTQDYQRIGEQVSERERDLNRMASELEDVRVAILENSQKVSDLKEASEVQKESIEAVISRMQSENDELRDRITQIDELQMKIIQYQEALKVRENQLVEASTVDFLKGKLLVATSMANGTMQNVVQGTVATFQGATDIIPSFREVRGTISTLQKQIKDMPSLVKGIMKESMAEAAAFFWDNFTNMVWSTIDKISRIGKETIFQYTKAAYSYIAGKVSVVVNCINLSLAALAILSGCAFIMTGTPFTFVATSVSGYLFIRGML